MCASAEQCPVHPESDRLPTNRDVSLRARKRLMHRSKLYGPEAERPPRAGCVKTYPFEKCRKGIKPYVRSIISTHDAQFLKNDSTRAAGIGVFTRPARGGPSEIRSGVWSGGCDSSSVLPLPAPAKQTHRAEAGNFAVSVSRAQAAFTRAFRGPPSPRGRLATPAARHLLPLVLTLYGAS
jgi:hypothetical protein